MNKPEKPRHERLVIRYKFSDGYDEIPLIKVTEQVIVQWAVLSTQSSDPGIRERCRKKIRMVATFCVAGQLYLNDQATKTRKPRKTLDGETSSRAIIGKLAQSRDALGDYLKPAELWPLYVSKLDELGLSPVDDKLGVDYSGGRTTKNAFRAALSLFRKNKSAT